MAAIIVPFNLNMWLQRGVCPALSLRYMKHRGLLRNKELAVIDAQLIGQCGYNQMESLIESSLNEGVLPQLKRKDCVISALHLM